MTDAHVAALPLAPKNPLSYWQRARALREYHTGMATLRDAGGPVSRFTMAPRRLMPPIVVAASPRALRDVLGRHDGAVDKATIHQEMRIILGDNLFDLPHDEWLPRRRALQPVFTKQHVRQFGGDMAEAAETVVAGWTEGGDVDLDAECRRLTLRALGRSVLGLDLDARADCIAEPLRTALGYIAGRATRPVRAPRWLPTPARRRALAARATMTALAREVLVGCRADSSRRAPLVRALMAATDPATGQGLSDDAICDELLVFMLAGHDTTATTLTYALWQLGRHPDVQDRVAAEVARLGDREITPEDVAGLGFTRQVLHEALRLCPPGPTGTRMTQRDIEVDGYRVPAGTLVLFAIMAVQHDPRLWERPLEFDPDRFSPENSKGRDRWQYLPFGAGPRSCIGDHFAMLEATLALATIVRRVQLDAVDADFPLALPFTMVAGGPIRARVRARRVTPDNGRYEVLAW
ncbi:MULTISPECIES: cytochrome P450 [Mycobacteriaceae]|uniref:cytochrome P450 n=1 Tax=Mycobacteriaceae TaxID=1762 RepID=UPI0007FC7FF2|nr:MULTISPECIES: cytochrome P450 [Mycobacteriaceae]MCK0175773.1 cytochrome P450 [Mycolicibacterium sp. F2034L]OBB60221.1 cytochrome P450 [Mycobacterium sp. 852013-51886_SCH5428379]